LAINGYFSIMSQGDTRVKRLSPAGALAIMDSYSQLEKCGFPELEVEYGIASDAGKPYA
jgi:hypothetical protein